MKHILLLAVVSLLCGCYPQDKNVGSTFSGENEYKEICIDGVVYLKHRLGYSGYMSVKFNKDSEVVTCPE